MIRLLLLTLAVISAPIYAQQSSLYKGVNHISSYIASGSLDKYDDLSQLDSIFSSALKFYNNDVDEALLALTFAAVPYNKVPLKFPVLGVIYYPLTSAPDSIFELKNKNLPEFIFFDSPDDGYGDRDKPAHFFGSAFISYSSNIFDLGDLIGYFVEVFEETFKVQSAIDTRDLITNKFGNIFGEALKTDKTVLPSHVLILHTIFYFRIPI